MRGRMGVTGLALLAMGCVAQTSGVEEQAPGVYRLTSSGSIAAATEKALGDAAALCAGQGRRAQILQREMDDSAYRLQFRCVDAGTAGAVIAANPFAPPPPPAATGRRVLPPLGATPIGAAEPMATRPGGLPPLSATPVAGYAAAPGQYAPGGLPPLAATPAGAYAAPPGQYAPTASGYAPASQYSAPGLPPVNAPQAAAPSIPRRSTVPGAGDPVTNMPPPGFWQTR